MGAPLTSLAAQPGWAILTPRARLVLTFMCLHTSTARRTAYPPRPTGADTKNSQPASTATTTQPECERSDAAWPNWSTPEPSSESSKPAAGARPDTASRPTIFQNGRRPRLTAH